MNKIDDRGAQARKIKLERHLDANAALARRTLENRKHTAAAANKSRQPAP